MEQSVIGQKIKTQIDKAKNVLVIAHQQPDADCLGSMVAVCDWLSSQNTKHVKFCLDQPPQNLSWLVNFEPVSDTTDELLKEQFDTVVVLDSGDLKYAGVDEVVPKLSGKPVVINIDHHATNQGFGDINLVDENAVSTTLILYELFKSLNFKISRQAASAMLAGIIFDTYNFTNPNTNKRAMEVAARLLSAGASLPHVSDSILKTKSIDSLKIWGQILIRLRYNPHFGMATTVITSDDLKDGVTKAEVTEGVANFLNNLAGAKAALILQQQDDMVKGSLRTNDDSVDVSKFARMFGGGGHKKASGFKVKGRLVEDENGHWQIK